MEFEIYKGDDSKWYWRLRAANGEIISHGEGYESKQSATDCIKLIKRAIITDEIPVVEIN